MPNRINPIAQYLMWLAATVTAYLAYAQFVVPKIEADAHITERKSPVRIASGPRTDRKKDIAHLFPTDAWELAPCKVLETAQGTILFRDYQPYDDGRVEVFPFTMVIRRDKEEEGPTQIANTEESVRESVPIVLRSSQKAVLQFERAFKLDNGDPGKIQHGQLNGQVSIYRPPSSIGADDDLKVLTSNVLLEKHKIYTVDDVEFEFGANHGYGRNLDIELSHETPLKALNTDFSKINGVRSLKLGFLQRLRIHPTPGKEKQQRMLSGQNAPLEISCLGAFRFDFDQQLATFDDRVVVKQLDNSGQSLKCQKLALLFDSKVAAGQPLTHSKTTAPATQNLQLRRVVATGTPVILNAVERDANVTANYVDYDLALNRIIARRPEGVSMKMGQQEFTSSEIEYRIREDGAIGPLIANGTGSMTRYEEGKGFSATWSKSLSIQPDTEQRKLITFGGQSEITLDQETTIAGSDMEILLWELANPKTAIQSPLAATNTTAETKSKNWKYLPHQLVAQGDVHINATQLAGNTRNLTLRWPRPETADLNRLFTPKPNAEPQIEPYRTSKTTLPQPIENRAQQFNLPVRHAPIDPRIRQVAFTQPLQIAENPKAKNKFLFDGDLVEVDFSGHERDAKISKLVIEGNVNVRELDPDNPQNQPVEIKGDQLYILPQPGAPDEELHRMTVNGHASIVGKGLNLSGSEIHMDQSANRLWVVGAGEMDIEQSAVAAETTPDGQPLLTTDLEPKVQPQDITLRWAGGMIFDGHKIYFEDNVSAAGLQTGADDDRTQIRSLSEGLSVKLSNPINFRNLKGGGSKDIGKVEIQEMILVDQISNEKRVFTKASADSKTASVRRPVVLEKHDIDPSGQMVAKQKIIVPHASIDVLTGNMRAAGPGTVMNWQLGDMSETDRPGIPLIQASTHAANVEKQNPGEQKTFVRVNFDNILIANQKEGRIRVDGKVRSLYAALDSFDQQFDPDNQTRPAGAIKMTCDQMEVAQWQPRDQATKSNEFTARGNSIIVGDEFRATGSRIDFSEAKGLLTLEGSPRDAANLTYIEPQTGNQRNLDAGKILYRPEDGWTDIQDVRGMSMEQNGSFIQN